MATVKDEVRSLTDAQLSDLIVTLTAYGNSRTDQNKLAFALAEQNRRAESR